MIGPTTDEKQGDIAGHKRSPNMDNRQNCIHSPRRAFFSVHLTGRVSKASESIHDDVIVRCYGGTINT